jgi:hypothetical protein
LSGFAFFRIFRQQASRRFAQTHPANALQPAFSPACLRGDRHAGVNAIPNTWAIRNSGAVDLIGNGFYSLRPEFSSYGVYVDLDGSWFNGAGRLTNSVSLTAKQTYTLQFDLGGNQRNLTADSVTIEFGTASRQINVAPDSLFTTYSLEFTPSRSGSYLFSFLDSGGDMQGASLDNVSVVSGQRASVPAPLPLLGIGSALALRRRLRRQRRCREG